MLPEGGEFGGELGQADGFRAGGHGETIAAAVNVE